jgi:rhamnosyl/mannosyltransferase
MIKDSKILCLSRAPLDYFGGIPAFCLNLYKNFGYKVTSYSYSITKIKKTINRKHGYINEYIFPSEFTFGTLAISLRYFLNIIKNHKKFKYIHLQHPDPFSALAVLISKLFNPSLKIYITWHAEIYKTYYLLSPVLLMQDLIIFFAACKIIYFTPSHIEDSFLAKVSFIKKKIIIIPNSIDINYVKSFHKNKVNSDFVKEKKVNLISIGRLVKYKGYEYAIKSLVNLKKDFLYNIIGEGPLKKELQNLINNLHLENRVKLLGEISESEKFLKLNDADIFLFPSITTSEAYGLVQLEAMCFELPIINTNLKNGVNFLVPPDVAITCQVKNISNLTDAINSLVENENLYKVKVSKVKNNLKRFSIVEMINIYKKIFKLEL